MNTEFEFDLQLARDPRSPAAARHVIDGLAGDMPADVVERFRIVASELVTNAVTHGRSSERVRMTASVDSDRMRLQVVATSGRVDDGEGGSDSVRLSKWGRFLVDRMADRWGVDRAAEPVVWCEFEMELGAGPASGNPLERAA